MNRILFCAFFFLTGLVSFSQGDYSPLSDTLGLEISSKIDKLKGEDGEFKRAVFLQINNQNEFDVEYSFSIDLYWQGKRVEYLTNEVRCVKAQKKLKGKLNGIYFTCDQLTNEQMESKDFEYDLSDLEVKEIEKCSSK